MVIQYSSPQQGLWTLAAWIGMNPHLASCVTLGKCYLTSRGLCFLLLKVRIIIAPTMGLLGGPGG